MSVRKLDKNGDWTFGQSNANYIKRDAQIAQNVVTRVRSFKNDWFLNTEANIDWFTILGLKNNKELAIGEVSRVVKATDGVQRLNSVTLQSLSNRNAIIQIDFTTIYNKNFRREVGINA